MADAHRSLHLWSGPRCLSTSLLYSFAQHPLVSVHDEPLYAAWLRAHPTVQRPYRDLVLAQQDNDSERAFTALLAPLPGRFVYAKHMAKQGTTLPPALLASGRHALLVREPAALLRSFAAVLEVSLEESGYPALVQLFSALRSATGSPPVVILSGDLQRAPEATLRALTGALGLPFDPAMLSWPAGPRPEDGCWAPWWYATTHASTGFAPPRAEQPEPLTGELAALAEECRPFYELLRKHATRPPLFAPQPPLPVEVDGGSQGCDGSVPHQGATHTSAADPRNATVLVGIRDGVSRRFELHQRAHAKVSVLDSGFLLGDGVWEGLRLQRGVVVFVKAHFQRLWEGAAALAMPLDFSRDDLLRMIYAVVDANGMTDGVHIRLCVTRGLKPTPYQDPRTTIGQPTVVVLAEWKAPLPGPPRPLRLATVAVRRGPPDVQDPSLNSHSKLNCIAACIAAANAGADEALMLDPHGFVATCNSTNFCIFRAGELWAPTTRYQMPGITRAMVLSFARAAGLTVRECDFPLAAVYGADQAFCTGTFAGLLPVASVDGRVIGSCCASTPADAVSQLRVLYAQAVEVDVAGGRAVAWG